jgi:hypothetical protein
MKLNKVMIETFEKVAHGTITIENLAKALRKSVNRMAEIIGDLEKEGFVTKHLNYTVRGSRKVIEPASTLHAIRLKELMFEYSGIKFEEILSDSKLLFLAAISEDWMTMKIASALSRVSKYMIDRYRAMLKNRGVIMQQSNLYKINEKAWPLIKEFLIAYKSYSNIRGQVRWKYQNETLFEVTNEELVQGSVTGLYSYKDYGVRVGVISALCHLPKKELSKEEIFIHSLFQVDDPRTLHLALTFYLKNELNYKRMLPLAMRYGKYTMFENLVKLLKTKEEIVEIDGLPAFERKDFIRIARMYGVKDV